MLENISDAMKQVSVAFEEMAQTIEILSDTITKLEAEVAYLKEANNELQYKVDYDFNFNRELRDFLTRY